MKLRVFFEPVKGVVNATAIDLEGEKLRIAPTGSGWLVIEDDGHFVVAYPPGVVRCVADVGALDKVMVKPSEDSGRRQQTRQGAAA